MTSDDNNYNNFNNNDEQINNDKMGNNASLDKGENIINNTPADDTDEIITDTNANDLTDTNINNFKDANRINDISNDTNIDVFNESNVNEGEVTNTPIEDTNTAYDLDELDFTSSSNNDTDKPIKYSYKKSIAVGLTSVILGGAALGYFLGAGFVTSNRIIKAIDAHLTEDFSFTDANDLIPLSANAELSPSSDIIASVIKEVENSIVNINIKSKATNSWYGNSYETEGSGSGIIYKVENDKIYIITNNHVVEDATNVTISITGEEQINAKLIGKDASSDLAVIYVEKKDMTAAGITNVKAAKLGNSNDLQVGENVIAIGNALGRGKTATLGIISASEKEMDLDGKKLTLLQTDAAINPGNSGGALVNAKGEVIGINTAKLSSTAVEGTGYAIPITTADEVIKALIENGTIDKPYLGISGYTIDDDFRRIYGVSAQGVFIANVEANSAAEKAGITISDIITGINNTNITSSDELAKEIAKYKTGDKISIHLLRNGIHETTVTATLQNLNEQF